MRAARITQFEGPGSVKIETVADPVPKKGEVLVQVKATALNRADLLQTMGLYPAPKDTVADIAGLELAGEVIASKSPRFKKGAKVMALVSGGAWAEQIAVDARLLMPMPKHLRFEEAAAIPEAFITAWDAIFLQGGATKGQSVLIHAAGSGVGTAAIQLVRALGLTAIGTARSPDKLERAKPLGLHHAVACPNGPDFVDAVKQATGGRGADVVLELVGGDYFPKSLEAAAPFGTVMLVGLTAGPGAEVNLGDILRKRLTVIGTTLRSRTTAEKGQVVAKFAKQVLPLFAKKKLAPIVGTARPMSEITEALEQLQRNESFGKVVMTW